MSPSTSLAEESYDYDRGTITGSAYELWFREGILVPEPSGGALLLLGALVCLHGAARKRKAPWCSGSE